MIKAHLLVGKIQEEYLNNLKVYPIYFPNNWLIIIKEQSDTFKKRFNLDSLGNKIRMKHPGVIAYNVSEKALNGKYPWLYVVEKQENIEDLEALSVDWVLKKMKDLGIEDKKLEGEIIATTLEYQNEIELKTMLENPSIIEGLSAYAYCKEVKKIYYKEEETVGYKMVNGKKRAIKEPKDKQIKLDFFHGFSGQVHEVISEPIFLTGDYVSLVLSFTYATMPITKEKQLIVHPSFRRWEFGEENKIEVKDSHSLYIRKKTSAKSSFYRFTIKKEEEKIFFRHGEEELFEQLVKGTIELQDILENPKKYMEHEDYFIGIPYGENSFGGSHNVGSGVEQQFKKAIYEDLLNNFSIFIPNIPIKIDKEEGKQKVNTSKLHQGKEKKKGKDRRTVHFDYADYKGKTEILNVAIFEDNSTLKKGILDIIEHSMIGIEKETEDAFFINTGNEKNVLLNITSCSKKNIDSKMKNDDKKEKSQRKKEIKELLKNENLPKGTFCLVEMVNYQKHSTIKGDPKNIIRETFANMEYKTQFIEPIKEIKEDMKDFYKNKILDNNYTRLEKSFLDVLSKSGFLNKMENFETNLYGFNVLQLKSKKKKRFIPVLSRVTKDTKEYHFLNNSNWISEEEILFKIKDVLNKALEVFEWSSIERRLSEILSQDKEHKILTLSASLRHRFIPNIRNAEISEDLFLLKQVPNLSICRLNHNRDVPGFYLYNEKKDVTTKTKGIIQINEWLYYSVGEKIDTDQTGKYATHFSDKKKKHQQRRLAEMLILTNTNIKKIDIARIVHNSRDLALTTNYHTKEEYCLYLIDNLKEYLK